jgi:hypothetical protein
MLVYASMQIEFACPECLPIHHVIADQQSSSHRSSTNPNVTKTQNPMTANWLATFVISSCLHIGLIAHLHLHLMMPKH